MTILSVRHVTVYRYSVPVGFGDHRMMFRPRDGYDQKVLEETLTIVPKPTRIRWLHDVFGNFVAVASFNARADELAFTSNIRLAHTPSNLPDLQIEPEATAYPFSYSENELSDLVPFITRRYQDPDNAVERWVRRFLRQGRSNETAALLMTITAGIKETFIYQRRAEQGVQEPGFTLRLGHGSCRDLALLMVEGVRALGFAARFVSGYIYVPARDDPDIRGGGATHAWCQVYLPGAGWVDFDPTNGAVGNRDLIRVAVARDPGQAMPLTGIWYGRAEVSLGMSVEVIVRRADEAGTATDAQEFS
jgi:transglutaminase-like putative cysteine protease